MNYNIKEIPYFRYIGEGVKLVTTGCCITEIESLGNIAGGGGGVDFK